MTRATVEVGRADRAPATPPRDLVVGDSDRTLMKRIRDGHVAAATELVDRYWSPLLAYALRIVSDRDLAQDVVQKTFILVWTKRTDWSPVGMVSAYLYRITRNLALNACRDEENLRRRHRRGGGMLASGRTPRTPEDDMSFAALRAEVEQAIEGLSTRRRQVFILSRFEHLSHREIADQLGRSQQTVSNQMSSALAHLRSELSHHRSVF